MKNEYKNYNSNQRHFDLRGKMLLSLFKCATFVTDHIRLAGDGRYDSPGHCARYCTYTMLEAVSIN